MNPVNKMSLLQNIYNNEFNNLKTKNNVADDNKDNAEISNTSRALDKLDKFLNLGRSDRVDIEGLNDAEKEEFIKMLAALLKRGIVGYEILEVNGKPEKHYIVNQIGNKRIYGAKLYKKQGYYRD